MNVPAVSVFEYHPFTVARIEGEHVILHIKVCLIVASIHTIAHEKA